MAHLFQVGAGSGGMPLLDMLCRDRRITRVTLVEPDVYRLHNVERHLFPLAVVGELKAALAQRWLKDRRPDLELHLLPVDLLDSGRQAEIEAAVSACDLGVCAADNEPAKYHFDALMRNELGRLDYNMSNRNRISFHARHTDYSQIKNDYFGNQTTSSLLTRSNQGATVDDVFTLGGANLSRLEQVLDGYSRFLK